MIELTLLRDAVQPQPEVCTLGMLFTGGGLQVLQTIELPWVANPQGAGGMRFESCIPTGSYKMTPRLTEAKGRHWILSNEALGVYQYQQDIPKGQSWGRCLALLHAANWAHELLGCCAPGKSRCGPLLGGNPFNEWMVEESVIAMNQLRLLLADENLITLKIV